MYLYEIIIDGFKSYAQKTVISGFDPRFNAITGLNGTGKSNILDSICFVLGIQNLSQVRAGNLQELVYKQGQAGVIKATVTLVFDNSDRNSSPVGYESHKQITVTRQVVIGGKNKYMINGTTVQQNQVQNLFHSVQLNVNNPHFLIMQGRITKVLNMKPHETLSMIEEAAGTRMFEAKKQTAIKTIEKKQLRVDEISKCMEDDITPTLDGLRNERQNYVKWQANNSELERTERFCVAWDYKLADDKLEKSESGKKEIDEERKSLEESKQENQRETENCLKKIRELEQQRDEEMDGEFQSLKKQEAEISKELVKANTLMTNHRELLEGEAEQLASLTRQLQGAEASVQAKERELEQFSHQLKIKEAEALDADKEANLLRERYQNACAGVADEMTADLLSIPEQIASWEKKLRESQSRKQQLQLKVTHLTENLRSMKKKLKTYQSDQAEGLKETEKLRRTIMAAEQEISLKRSSSTTAHSLDIDESAMRSKVESLMNSSTQLRDSVRSLTVSLQTRLAFEFSDPERGFDRSRVKGLVARLVKIPDPSSALALEVAAGAKLYQVVVDNENTGKLLLERGALKKRVTILPLNKINNRCTEATKVTRAKEIATSRGGNAHLALELVGFEEEVRAAMQYVFGSVIICDNSEIAKSITFDKHIRNRTVTLEGDSFDPAGTITGGSNNSLGDMLAKISELAIVQKKLNEEEEELHSLQERLRILDEQEDAVRDITMGLERNKHALRICEEKIAASAYGHLNADIQQSEEQLESATKEIGELEKLVLKSEEELQRLSLIEGGAKKNREAALKQIENQLKAKTKASSALNKELTQVKARRETLVAEISSLRNEITITQNQIKSSEANHKKLEREFEIHQKKLSECQNSYNDAKQAVLDKQQDISRVAKEIKSFSILHEKCQKSLQSLGLEIRKVEHKLKQWEKEVKDAERLKRDLLKAHPWIEKEKVYFGQKGSDFDFETPGRDANQCRKRLQQLQSEQEGLSRKINKKVMGMIEKAESEYNELNRKKQVILNDKAKIEAVIQELDVKKTQALENTWVKVNRDFGSIFSMLLPGTTAKLEPVEGCSVSEGLEVKVAFNGVWKDSLTELSGGQRSLLALSLILALLLFKPAPMYILDEVDAALDLSHTQNIGLMLRQHFSSSQFIVVSLKEGMFNNANVIFRTKFVDGVSAVSRTAVGGRGVALLPSSELDSRATTSSGKPKKNQSSVGPKKITAKDQMEGSDSEDDAKSRKKKTRGVSNDEI